MMNLFVETTTLDSYKAKSPLLKKTDPSLREISSRINDGASRSCLNEKIISWTI